MKTPDTKTLLIAITVLLLGIFGFLMMENSREPTLGEAIDDAAHEISNELNRQTR